jgi:hypothetical protein
MPDPLSDLLAHEGFQTGLLFGIVAALVVVVVVVVGRRSHPWAGAAFVLAGIAAVHDLYRVEIAAVAGLVLVIACGHVAAGRAPTVQLVAVVPGTVLFALAADLDRPAWAVPAIVTATLVGGLLVASFDRVLGPRGVAPVLLAVTVLGIYLTTPDTEHSAVLLGAAVPVALLSLPWPLATLGVGGSFAAVALVAWDVAVDGMGRDGAVVGGLACLGMLVVEPVVRWAAQGRGIPPAPVPLRYAATVVALHVGVVAVCSRVGGLRSSAIEAFVVCALAYVVAAAVLVVQTTRRPVAARLA